MALDYVKAISEQNFSGTLKLLDGAIKAAAASRSGNTALAQLHINRGFCHQKLQLYRKALKDYDDALELDPQQLLALYRKGQVLVALKKSEAAKDTWNDALRLAGPSSDVQVILDLQAAVRDPDAAKVWQDLPSKGAHIANRGGRAALLLLSVLVLLMSCVLAGQRYKMGFILTVGPASSTAPSTEPATSLHSSSPATPSPAPSPVSNGHASHDQPSAAATPQAQPAKPQAQQSQASASKHAAKPSTPAATATVASSSSSGGACDVEELDCVAHQASTPKAVHTDMHALNNSIIISQAVTQINNGKVAEAEALLDRVITTTPKELGARVARGTARALHRDLQGAIEDFSVAIEVEPRYADSWKRRGQARSALGEHENALTDLQKAIELAPLFGQDTASTRAECHVEKGMIYQKLRDYRRACRELQQAVKLDPGNFQAWNVLGLCSTSQGDIRDGVKAYEKAVEINPKLREAFINMGQALKEEGRTKEAERVFAKALALDTPDSPSVHVMRIMAQMKQQKGEHAGAIKMLDKAVAINRDDQMVELLYLRAICYHALGYVREAVRDYEACLQVNRPNMSEEARTFQFLSFYQKELALYTFNSLDRAAVSFCPDSELPALFKELWCKKGPPTAEMIATYRAQAPVPATLPPPPPPPDAAKLQQLTSVADQLGNLLQNHHQGFLPNVRQQRAAGYAALELGQALQALLSARRAGRQHWTSSEGSSSQAGSAGRHLFGWRDAMDIVVKWRQLAEPNDQVVWVDLLTRREFEQGFGSHTPMFSGQTKCVRYYMNFKRALGLQRDVLLKEGHAFDAQNRPIPLGAATQQDAIRKAQTAEDMYHVIKQDSWVVVPIHSVARSGHMMEGTRLTLVRVPNQPDAYEFSIRTPVTPPRWRDFDTELEAAWDSIVKAMDEGNLHLVAESIMTYCYYWYNFMPLARGTAAVGYTTLLSLFWAAGMPVYAPIPKDYQVDWEAILAQHPQQFATSVGKWLYPPAAHSSDATAAPASPPAVPGKPLPAIDTLPLVSEVLSTLRQRLEALNGEGAKRL